jgi:PAS domain S-box-containing protein
MAADIVLTGVERRFQADEIIVSKTDRHGKILYANDVFINISGYTENELLDKPHSLIRHPHMPRAVFKLLWDTIERGDEIYAYVVNRAKNGDHYWVLAHVTPNLDANGGIIGYHSSRRVVRPQALAKVQPLYQSLLEIEARNPDRRAGLAESFARMHQTVASLGFDGYDRFVFSL